MAATKPYTHSPLVYRLHKGAATGGAIGAPLTPTTLQRAAEYIDALEGLVEAYQQRDLYQRSMPESKAWNTRVVERRARVQQLIKQHLGED